jgi:hypothetical protein
MILADVVIPIGPNRDSLIHREIERVISTLRCGAEITRSRVYRSWAARVWAFVELTLIKI